MLYATRGIWQQKANEMAKTTVLDRRDDYRLVPVWPKDLGPVIVDRGNPSLLAEIHKAPFFSQRSQSMPRPEGGISTRMQF